MMAAVLTRSRDLPRLS